MKIRLPESQKEIELQYFYGTELRIQELLTEDAEFDTKGGHLNKNLTGKTLSKMARVVLEEVPQNITYEEIMRLSPKDGRFLKKEIDKLTSEKKTSKEEGQEKKNKTTAN